MPDPRDWESVAAATCTAAGPRSSAATHSTAAAATAGPQHAACDRELSSCGRDDEDARSGGGTWKEWPRC